MLSVVCAVVAGTVKAAAGQPAGMAEIGPEQVAAFGRIMCGTAIGIGAQAVFTAALGCCRNGLAAGGIGAAVLWGNAAALPACGLINGVAVFGQIMLSILKRSMRTTGHNISSNTSSGKRQ